jgi:tetratricopeptide (TPR) repeat protein/DNA-binding CsgD family transcriptional regulator
MRERIRIKIRILFIILLGVVGPKYALSQEVDSAIQVIDALPDDTIKVWEYSKVFDERITYDIQTTNLALNRMRALSEKLKYDRGIWYSRFADSRILYRRHQPDSAITILFSLQEEPYDSITINNQARLHNTLAVCYQLKNENDISIMHLNKSLEYFKAVKDYPGIISNLNNMGIAYCYMGKLLKGKEYFEEAYRIVKDHQVDKHLEITVSNLISVSLDLETIESDSMLMDLLRSPALDANFELKASVYANIGSYYMMNHNWDKAEEHLLIAENIYKELEVEANPEVVVAIANFYYQTKRFDKALGYYYKIIYSPESFVHNGVMYKNISKIFKERNMPDSVYKYYELLIDWKDSTNKFELKQQYSKAESNLKVLKNEAKINELESKTKLLNTTKTKNRYIIIAMSLLIAIILIVIYINSKNQKIKEANKQRELELEQQKLKDLSTQIARKNQLIESIEDELKSFSQIEEIKEELSSSIKKSFNLDGDWESFKLYFEDQNKGFYNQLKNHFPNLTNNDLRICSLSKMRLSTKEMANVLSLSVDAIKSSRYRLRKKLNIPQDSGLSDFLNQINGVENE